MTIEKVKAVAEMYREKGGALYCERSVFMGKSVEHVAWMCDSISAMDDLDKASRWLGFVQGYLWTTGIYSIDEMREHNRDSQ